MEDLAAPAARDDLMGVRFTALAGTVTAPHSRLTECLAESASVDRFDLTGAALADVRLRDIRATELIARDGRWHSVVIGGGRIGTLDLMRAEVEAVVITDLRIDYLSLASARVQDLRLVRCDVGAIDLPEAKLDRVAFEACRADEIDTRGLRARDLDLRGIEVLSFTDPTGLRGATLSARQAAAHGPALAAALGIATAAELP